MSRNVEAVVFDMDGVLIDSREFISEAMLHALGRVGVIARAADIAAVTGKPIHVMYELLAPEHDARELEAYHKAHHLENLHLLQSYEGVHELLGGLRHDGYKLGLFTGGDKLTYDRLEQFELTDYFDSIFDVTRYTRHKPDPEGLQLCMGELGVTAAETVYVGDGVGDMIAGQAAAVRAVVGITHGFGSAQELGRAGATHLVDSLSELPDILQELRI